VEVYQYCVAITIDYQYHYITKRDYHSKSITLTGSWSDGFELSPTWN